ncbi:MAG: hypothetical protein KIT10_14315 [Flavobacteriales bacterium]|nr:hypothetical protein [Flavobacteriales bacterium]
MNKFLLAITAITLLTLTACKKDEPLPPTPDPTPTEATIRMAFHWKSGLADFNINNTYQDGAGNPVRFTFLKFYASDFHLTNDDGAQVAEFHNKVLLVDAASSNNTFTLGTMPPGHVHEVHLVLGLDSATNHADPMQAPYPLDQPNMHWFWNPTAGYIFLKAEGYVDVNGNGSFDPGVDQGFEYHCATLALRREKHMHMHMDAMAGQTHTLEAQVDVNMLLMGLDLLANPVGHGGGANAQAMMDNLVTAISAH